MLEAFARYWHGDQDVPQFLLQGRDPDEPARKRVAFCGALLAQSFFILMALFGPSGGGPVRSDLRVEADLRRAMPLVAPNLDEFRLTQKEPQRSKPSTEVDLAGLLPKPEVIQAPRPSPRGFVPPAGSPRPVQQQAVVEAPRIEMAQQGMPANPPPSPLAELNVPPPPKSPFESVSGQQGQAATQARTPVRAQIEVSKGRGGRDSEVDSEGRGRG